VRVPKEVLGELGSVRRYVGTEVLDIPILRYVAMETDKACPCRVGRQARA
jgi:hypothetical protein